ncbi:TetR/AcrR family transcriptional regulator [Companilactobacillus paralimentarius]|uniref:TetR/AcrR family transcriptional regulator n=1 Tax=Companilactobacillus paralimentarius TaxID=83526 RepID=UPI00385008E3
MAGLKNQTKQNIINLTIKLIDDNGYTNISLRKLVLKLGLTTGSFYKHFSTKNELWLEVTRDLSQQIANTASKNIDLGMTPEQNIVALAVSFLEQYQTHPNIMDFLLFNPMSQADLNQSSESFKYLQIIDQLITEVINKNHMNKDKQTLFIQLWSFIQGYGILIKNNSVSLDQSIIQITLNNFLKE